MRKRRMNIEEDTPAVPCDWCEKWIAGDAPRYGIPIPVDVAPTEWGFPAYTQSKIAWRGTLCSWHCVARTVDIDIGEPRASLIRPVILHLTGGMDPFQNTHEQDYTLKKHCGE